MDSIVKMMDYVLVSVNTMGKYIPLFLLALFVLMILWKPMDKRLWWFSVSTTIIVLCPITVWFIVRVFAGWVDYYRMLYLLPIFIILPYTITRLLMENTWRKKKSTQIMFVVAIAVIFILSISRTLPINAEEEINQKQVIMAIEEQDAILLSTDEIMNQARKWNPAIQCLYGADLWDEGIQNRCNDFYENDKYVLHELMQDFEQNIDRILEFTMQYQITHLILSTDITINTAMKIQKAGYLKQYENQDYQLYTISHR